MGGKGGFSETGESSEELEWKYFLSHTSRKSKMAMTKDLLHIGLLLYKMAL